MSRLAELQRRIAACNTCRTGPAALPHAPRPIVRLSASAPILIASQAPGARAHATGVPFDDPSGVRLRSWLGVTPEIFYDVERFAILPMGFCFPGHDGHGGDLPPRPQCRAKWHDEIMAALPALELILMIGRFAHRYHLGRVGRLQPARQDVGSLVRDWRSVLSAGQPRLFALPHPSWRNSGWLRKHPWFAVELLPHLQSEVRRLVG